tara:strand:+ start:204 stop:887 length:684 start_codon:yes stop_codon:yes gene_type:complete
MNELNIFQDTIKSSSLDIYSGGNLTIADIGISLIFTFIISLGIFYIYKKIFRGVLYIHSFNVSLVMISLVTSLVIMTISTNLILSLGMVGALSIVRFRTAVKDPMDIVFMFWAIAVGIANGAQQFLLSLTGSIFIGIIIYILSTFKLNHSPYLLIVHYKIGDEDLVLQKINTIVKKYKIKSKTISNDLVEYTLEIRIDNNDTKFLIELDSEKIIDKSLVSYDGDYAS